MDKELVDQILQSLRSVKQSEKVFLQNKLHTLNTVHKPIMNCSNQKTIAFVDGGQMELFSAANFVIAQIRIYQCTYKENKRVSAEKKEFTVMVKPIVENENLIFHVECFGDSLTGQMKFVASDPDLKRGRFNAELQSIVGIIRRINELKFAIKIKEYTDFVVIDGLLDPQNSVEEKMILSNQLIGIAKTSSFITESGDAVVSVVAKNSPSHPWYSMLEKDSSIQTMFVKFHEKSNHILTVQSINTDSQAVDSVLSSLSKNSTDPVFFGYPYGLIEADRFARIQQYEREMLQARFKAYAGKWFAELIPYLSTKNAHDILDSIG